MQKLINVIIILLLPSCVSEPEYTEVRINKTVKVYSHEYHDNAENYTFKWEPPVDPNNEPVHFDLKNDMLIFTPTLNGDYQVHLSIIDISDEVVKDEMFYYKAVSETLKVAIVNPNIDHKSPEHSVVIDKSKGKSKSNSKKTKTKKNKNELSRKYNKVKINKNIHYTIQVIAWPSLEQARSDQLKLIEEGIDAYIQRHYKVNNDEIWYRVRVGNFTNKNKAIEIQKQLEKITGNKSWLDIMHTE